MYSIGRWVERDLKKAREHWERAGTGHFALRFLAEMYAFGLGVTKDVQKAKELLEAAKEWGEDCSECLLAVLFSDIPKIQAVLKKLGGPYGPHGIQTDFLFHLAERFLLGDGVERDIEKAQLLFNYAASRQHLDARATQSVLFTIQSTRPVGKDVRELPEDWATHVVPSAGLCLGQGSYGTGDSTTHS